jgi:hypothetical protein
MKFVTLVIGLVMLGGSSAIARADDTEQVRMHDGAWIRAAGERLAR